MSHSILIADDSPTDRLILQTILKQQGYSVITAVDGVEAVELYRRERPAIVLMDALMPRMDGFTAAREIKALAGETLVPLIFLTSLQEADSLARCVDAGGDDFLTKPYNAIILQAKLNAFSRMRAMAHTLQQQRDEISGHHNRLLREQEVARRVYDKVTHRGCLDAANIQYSLSPLAAFNGDVVLAAVTPAGRLLVMIGDFTGHGLPAALGAMPLAQSFYAMAEKGVEFGRILHECNARLHEILPIGVFCCAAVAEFDFYKGTVQVWNGGMPDGLIHRVDGSGQTRLPSRHLPLGILGIDSFDSSAEIHAIQPGDRLYLWSDGIHEAQNTAGEMFGEQRLLAVFADNRDPRELFKEINIGVNSFISEDSIADDISLLEVTMVEAGQFTSTPMRSRHIEAARAQDWQLDYLLRADSLRDGDPLPLLLDILLQVPQLRAHAGKLHTVLAELFSNALEHGVLELDSGLKQSTNGFAEYYLLRKQRLAALRDGSVQFSLRCRGSAEHGELEMLVQDSGAGFDWQPQRDRSQSGQLSGRGLALLQAICRHVEYLPPGNRVRVIFGWP